jgi:hypothetical protein
VRVAVGTLLARCGCERCQDLLLGGRLSSDMACGEQRRAVRALDVTSLLCSVSSKEGLTYS